MGPHTHTPSHSQPRFTITQTGHTTTHIVIRPHTHTHTPSHIHDSPSHRLDAWPHTVIGPPRVMGPHTQGYRITHTVTSMVHHHTETRHTTTHIVTGPHTHTHACTHTHRVISSPPHSHIHDSPSHRQDTLTDGHTTTPIHRRAYWNVGPHT